MFLHKLSYPSVDHVNEVGMMNQTVVVHGCVAMLCVLNTSTTNNQLSTLVIMPHFP